MGTENGDILVLWRSEYDAEIDGKLQIITRDFLTDVKRDVEKICVTEQAIPHRESAEYRAEAMSTTIASNARFAPTTPDFYFLSKELLLHKTGATATAVAFYLAARFAKRLE